MELGGPVKTSPDSVITSPRATETPVAVINSGDGNNFDVVGPAQSIRHSLRQQQLPKRLQYSGLGNPLISVVQTLFHSLADACGEAFTSPASNTAVCSRVHVVLHAPELHGFKGGRCNPGDKCHFSKF